MQRAKVANHSVIPSPPEQVAEKSALFEKLSSLHSATSSGPGVGAAGGLVDGGGVVDVVAIVDVGRAAVSSTVLAAHLPTERRPAEAVGVPRPDASPRPGCGTESGLTGTLIPAIATGRRVPTCRLVDLGKPAKRRDDIEAVTIAEHTGHGDRSGELLEVFGGRVVGHPVDHDEGV